ncbi:MAG: DNRLRE domain-containing protein [Chitinophagales bacterium]
MKAVKHLLLVLSLFLLTPTNAQVIIQPDGNGGKDAYIDTFYTLNPGSNFINHGNYFALGLGVDECYPDGFNELCWKRILIGFDLSSLNGDTSFSRAQLVLHTYAINPSPVIDSTVFRILRIIQPWKEDSVLWANQPAVDSSLSQTFTIKPGMSDSISINIAELLRAQLTTPATSFGFLLSYTIANRLGSIAAYASENETAELRPKLVVDYRPTAVSGDDEPTKINVYPNPFNEELTIATLGTFTTETMITLKNILGEIVFSASRGTEVSTTWSTNQLPSGVYFLEIAENGFKAIHRLIKQ